MKKIAFSLMLVMVALTVSRCCKTYLSATDAILNLLKANGRTWTVSRVTVNDTDVTSDLFPAMTMKFTDTNYTTSKGGSVWAPSGTWGFASETGDRISRALAQGGFPALDNIDVVVTETQLTLSFRFPFDTVGLPGGRGESVEDALYVFIFNLI